MAKLYWFARKGPLNLQNPLHQQEGCEQFVSLTVLVPIEIDAACACAHPQWWKGGDRERTFGNPCLRKRCPFHCVWLWNNIHNYHVFSSLSSCCWASFFKLLNHIEVSFTQTIHGGGSDPRSTFLLWDSLWIWALILFVFDVILIAVAMMAEWLEGQ